MLNLVNNNDVLVQYSKERNDLYSVDFDVLVLNIFVLFFLHLFEMVLKMAAILQTLFFRLKALKYNTSGE